MKYLRLGKTDLMVSRTSFGALPIQRTASEEVTRILHRAVDAGVNFIDTARFYTDSEQKIGNALSGKRDKIYIATKSMATTKDQLLLELEESLRYLKTDYVDILQLHNPFIFPDVNDPESSIAGLEIAQKKGLIRFKGFTNHSRSLANTAISSGIFDTIQFPLSMIASEEDWDIAENAKAHDLGVIAMKAMSGGLITNATAAFAFMAQYDFVVPIWGIQHMSELEEFLGYEKDEPQLDDTLKAQIQNDKNELAGDFCRGCGYCLPCPASIPIPWAARMGLLLRRMPYQELITPEWQEKMDRIDDCTNCGTCKMRCPYSLDTPVLLKKMKGEYNDFLKNKGLV